MGNMEVEKCWRAQVEILGGRSCVRWISREFGVRKVATGERKGEEGEGESAHSDFGIYGEKLVGGLYAR